MGTKGIVGVGVAAGTSVSEAREEGRGIGGGEAMGMGVREAAEGEVVVGGNVVTNGGVVADDVGLATGADVANDGLVVISSTTGLAVGFAVGPFGGDDTGPGVNFSRAGDGVDSVVGVG